MHFFCINAQVINIQRNIDSNEFVHNLSHAPKTNTIDRAQTATSFINIRKQPHKLMKLTHRVLNKREKFSKKKLTKKEKGTKN